MLRSEARRALALLGTLLVLLAVVLDLTAPNSLLRRAWRAITPTATPAERLLRDIQQQGPAHPRRGTPIPPRRR